MPNPLMALELARLAGRLTQCPSGHFQLPTRFVESDSKYINDFYVDILQAVWVY